MCVLLEVQCYMLSKAPWCQKGEKKPTIFCSSFTLAETWARGFESTWLPVKVIARLSQDFLYGSPPFSPSLPVLLVPQTVTDSALVHPNGMKVGDRGSWKWNIYYEGGILETLGLRYKASGEYMLSVLLRRVFSRANARGIPRENPWLCPFKTELRIYVVLCHFHLQFISGSVTCFITTMIISCSVGNLGKFGGSKRKSIRICPSCV